jgi:membrane-bound lytic murein transglycosylase C
MSAENMTLRLARAYRRWRATGRARRLVRCAVVLAAATLSGSCATTKVVGANIKRVVDGKPLDSSGLNQAVASDTKVIEANLQQLRGKFAEALAVLKSNVQKRWGHGDAKVADRTVYVKYTQGYKSRVITDFDHGSLTVETLDDKDPQGSLKSAIVAALLTSNDPATVDLFSDKEVTLEADRKPYLYGLVHDNRGKAIRTREQAERFANFLVPLKVQSRAVTGEQGGNTARFVKLAMVKNFEAKGAERYRASVLKYSAQYHVSPSLVFAIMRTESNFNPFAVSGAPAYGLMQLVPTSGGRAGLQRVQGVDHVPTPDYLFDPEHNIELGTAYLSVLGNSEFHAVDNLSSRDYCVIAAYNTGPRNVTRTFASDRKQALSDINALEPAALYDRLRTDLPFEETRHYVVKVSGYRAQFANAAVGAETAMQ